MKQEIIYWNIYNTSSLEVALFEIMKTKIIICVIPTYYYLGYINKATIIVQPKEINIEKI